MDPDQTTPRASTGAPDRRAVPARAALVVLGALLGPTACADTSNRADVYEEDLPSSGLPRDRDYAFRISLFEYSRRVGGFIEFYEIDGQRNTWTNPYFAPNACEYFGAGRLENDEFPIDVPGPEGRFVLTVNLVDGGRKLVGRLSESGGTWDGDGTVVPLDFVRTDQAPDGACPASGFADE